MDANTLEYRKMNAKITILIADRNPHVRDFLKREMLSEGYQVRLAKSGREVLNHICGSEPVELLILDWDLPDSEEIAGLVEKINNRIPTLPVVIHSFSEDEHNQTNMLSNAVFVEKRGNSIDYLRKIVSELVSKSQLSSLSSDADPGKVRD
jgi:DNA-binding NtrC family response regulator